MARRNWPRWSAPSLALRTHRGPAAGGRAHLEPGALWNLKAGSPPKMTRSGAAPEGSLPSGGAKGTSASWPDAARVLSAPRLDKSGVRREEAEGVGAGVRRWCALGARDPHPRGRSCPSRAHLPLFVNTPKRMNADSILCHHSRVHRESEIRWDEPTATLGNCCARFPRATARLPALGLDQDDLGKMVLVVINGHDSRHQGASTRACARATAWRFSRHCGRPRVLRSGDGGRTSRDTLLGS